MALLRKITCNLRHPMRLRHPVCLSYLFDNGALSFWFYLLLWVCIVSFCFSESVWCLFVSLCLFGVFCISEPVSCLCVSLWRVSMYFSENRALFSCMVSLLFSVSVSCHFVSLCLFRVFSISVGVLCLFVSLWERWGAGVEYHFQEI